MHGNVNGFLIALLIIILAAASEPPNLPIPPLPDVMPRLNPYGGR